MPHLGPLLLALSQATMTALASPADAPPPDAGVVQQAAAAPAVDEARDAALKSQPAPPPPQETESAELNLFVVANLDGALARPRCRETTLLPESNRYYAQQVAFYAHLAAAAAARPERLPLALDVGDSIFPGAIARYLLTQGEDGAAQLAEILAQIPFALHGVGNHDLSPPRSEIADFVHAAHAAGLTLRVANLRCPEGGEKRAICAITPSAERPAYVVAERGRFRVGVLALIDPQVSETLSRGQLAGLEIVDPREALTPLVQRLREQEKVDLVVVLFHINGPDPVGRSQQLATSMPGIDVIATNVLFDTPLSGGDEASTRENGYVVAPQTGTFIVGADTGSRHVLTVRLQASRAGGERWRVRRMTAQRVAVDDLDPEPVAGRMLEEASEQFCRDWGQPIRDEVALAKPFTFEEFEQFVLNVMRFSTESEVAISNARAFRNSPQFPLSGTLTRADVYAALPYGNRLMTIRLSGSTLLDLTSRLGSQLVAAGLEKGPDDKWVVNGRPIDKDRLYRVAINQYLAEGGDRVFTPKQVADAETYQPDWSAEPPGINDLVIHFVESGEYQQLGGGGEAAKLSPTGNFPDLFQKLLWRYTGSLTLGLNKSSVDNPSSRYTASQLTVSSTTQVNFELKGLVHGESRMHGFDDELLAQYATARLPGVGYEPTKDFIRGRSSYKLLGVRSFFNESGWVPVPLAEAQLETEFRHRPIGTDRTWRRLQLTGIVGASIKPVQPLELKIGFNARRDLNAPRSQPGGRLTYGVNVGYVLQRFDLVSVSERPIQFESDLDYFFNDLGGDNISELTNNYKLKFGIFDQLFFTTNLSVYLFRAKPVSKLGSNMQLTVGLNYLWDYVAQTF